ncbi:hypothetical protein WR25_04013 [Diploscapter pachys]|uniref:Uncharacterized protein n=1 Tax=Diploscapter pachys TaxID=2018661 RepID=A0A2A2JAU9_9BILA|nr:hypothetical protein WR25_04013 [Diploscapter pachys]
MQRADESSSSSATSSENSYRFFLATGLFPYPPAISLFGSGSGSTLPANNQQSPTFRRPSDFSPHSLALLTNRHIAYPTPTGKSRALFDPAM